MNNGSAIRPPENVSPDPTTTYDDSDTSLGVLLGHLERESPDSASLAQVVKAWPNLPEHVRQTITTLIENSVAGGPAG